MTEGRIYEQLLLLRQCVKTRKTCNRHCSDCKLWSDEKEVDEALCQAIAIVKARNPELYFFDDFDKLAQVIKH